MIHLIINVLFIEPLTLSKPSLVDNKGYWSKKDEAMVC